MTKLMTANNPVAELLLEALGIPSKNVTKVQLNIMAGSLTEVQIMRYVEVEECEYLLARLEDYNITAELKENK